MPDTGEEVTLSYEGEQYTLQRRTADGQKTEIVLTLSNLLAILPHLQRACSQRLEKRAGPILRLPGVSPIVPMTAGGYDVTTDAFHKDEVFLTLADNYRNFYSFALSPQDALKVAARIAEKVRDLPKERSRRQ